MFMYGSSLHERKKIKEQDQSMKRNNKINDLFREHLVFVNILISFLCVIGMPSETTVAICSMIFGGIFEKFPKLKVCFAHGGIWKKFNFASKCHFLDLNRKSKLAFLITLDVKLCVHCGLYFQVVLFRSLLAGLNMATKFVLICVRLTIR